MYFLTECQLTWGFIPDSGLYYHYQRTDYERPMKAKNQTNLKPRGQKRKKIQERRQETCKKARDVLCYLEKNRPDLAEKQLSKILDYPRSCGFLDAQLSNAVHCKYL